MNKIVFLSIWLLLISYMTGFAQEATLKGVVTDKNTGEPLYPANVIIDAASGLGTVTDFDGNYIIDVDPGTYTVKCTYIGYAEKTVNVNIAPGETKTLNIAISESMELLDVVVVSASKFEKKLSEETVSMEVVSPSLLQNNNITDMEEGMKRVPGVTVVEGQANIRGGSGWAYGAGSRVLILVDDLPLQTVDAADAKWALIPIENTNQVEVIKGAASALYGSSALNGVINVRTAYPTDEPYTSVSFTSGVYGHPKSTYFDTSLLSATDPAVLTINQREYAEYQEDSATHLFNNANYWRDQKDPPFFTNMMIAHRRKVGRVDLVGGLAYDGKKSYLNGGSSQNIRTNLKIRYRTKKPGLSIGINTMFYRSWGQTFFIWNGAGRETYQPLAGTVSDYVTTRATVDPFITYLDQKNNRFSIRSRFFNATNTNNTNQGSVPNLYYGEFQYQRRIEKWDLNVVTGAVGWYGTVRSPDGTPENSLIGEHEGFNVGAYAQFDKKLFDRLSLALGLRYEYTEYDQSFQSDLKRPTVRVGLNYQAARATFLRASYGEGYRFPSMAELFVSTNIGALDILPNPSLQPEDGISGEVAIKQGFKFGNFQGYADLAFFVNAYKDMMEFTFATNDLRIIGGNPDEVDVGFSSQNVGDTRILGTEFTLAGTGNITEDVPITVMFGYTYIDPRSLNWDDSLQLYDKTGEQIEISPAIATFGGVNLNNVPEDGNLFTYGTYSSSNSNVMKYRYRHTIKMDVQVSVGKFDFGTNIQANSFMENVDYLFVSPLLGLASAVLFEEETKAFTDLAKYRDFREGKWDVFLDLRASVRPSEETKLTFIVKNVINQEATIRPALPAPPRNYALQFTYTFKGK